MKHFYGKLILIILIIGIFLTGCSKINFDTYNASDEEINKYSVTIDPEKGVTKSPIDQEEDNITPTKEATKDGNTTSISSASATPSPVPIQPTATKDLPVYTINSDDGEIIPVTAAVPEDSEITPNLIVDTVIESMADHSIIVGIKDVTTDKDTVIVNFDKNKTPYNNTGSEYEASILNAIAQSLIDNLPDLKKVVFRVNDGAYVSGAFEFKIDEAYLEDNN